MLGVRSPFFVAPRADSGFRCAHTGPGFLLPRWGCEPPPLEGRSRTRMRSNNLQVPNGQSLNVVTLGSGFFVTMVFLAVGGVPHGGLCFVPSRAAGVAAPGHGPPHASRRSR